MIAGHALKANITTLGPLVLPVSEQLLFLISLVMRKVRCLSLRPRMCFVWLDFACSELLHISASRHTRWQ